MMSALHVPNELVAMVERGRKSIARFRLRLTCAFRALSRIKQTVSFQMGY